MRQKTRRLVFDALLTAIALTIFIIELQIPSPVSFPGVKLGLANIITLGAFYLLGAWDALAIMLIRVVLGCVFSGQVMALAYSLAGGTLCYITTLCLHKIIRENQIFIMSILGAIAHNIGQVLMAVLITGTGYIAVYLPMLMIAGIITGTFTGLAAQFVVGRLRLQVLKK